MTEVLVLGANGQLARKHDSIFMGLAITRSIVESHGGRLWAIANSGPGATFLFTVPGDARP